MCNEGTHGIQKMVLDPSTRICELLDILVKNQLRSFAKTLAFICSHFKNNTVIILVDVKWYVILILICFFIITNGMGIFCVLFGHFCIFWLLFCCCGGRRVRNYSLTHARWGFYHWAKSPGTFCIFSLNTYLCRSFTHFKIRLFLLTLNFLA